MKKTVTRANHSDLNPVGGAFQNPGSGFTLVEALVVAVIMAILAAISIPIYSGYVTGQRQQAAQTMAQVAVTAANSYYRRNNADPPDSASLKLFLPSPTQFGISVSPGAGTVTVTEKSKSSPTVSTTLSYR